jgi:lipopolysaccharide transport system ATP-binding protein
MDTAIISVENLGKMYRIRHQQAGRYTALRDVIAQKCAAPFRRFLRPAPPAAAPGEARHSPAAVEDFWALKDVSFEIKPGEVVGIIGRNGAGKSTLLKLLSRITEPSTGCIRLRGRVASLLEVGTGFHPELTGRENIYLNGAILGMTKVEIKKKFDEIVAFSEVEQFLDTPVKRYSSGMYVRLAFAVAAHLEPEILVVDEVLAVGDAQFQKKCLGKMRDVSTKEARTVFFVSHNMGAVEALCRRGLLLQNGQLAFDGNITETIEKYLASFDRPAQRSLEDETDRGGNGKVRLRSVQLLFNGEETDQAITGTDVTLRFDYANPAGIGNANILFTIYTDFGVAVMHLSNAQAGYQLRLRPEGGVVMCKLPCLTLNQGRYRVAAAVTDEGGECLDHLASAICFDVVGSRFYASGKKPDPKYALVLAQHEWS